MRSYKLYLDDIIKACSHILMYTSGQTVEVFKSDQKTIDAVIRNIEIIGEAAKKSPDEVKEQYPQVHWRESTAMRNIVMHEYFGIDLEIIWETIQTDIPILKKEIGSIQGF